MSDITIPKPPPKAPPVNYAQIVALFGEALWGSKWARDVGRVAKVNPRTVSRIYTAAKEGRDYPAARGVIQALYRELAPIIADLKPWAAHASED